MKVCAHTLKFMFLILMTSKLIFTVSCRKLKMARYPRCNYGLENGVKSDRFIGNISNFSVFFRTEMVWDDAMQEPTAADHGDVLYNIGINLCLE